MQDGNWNTIAICDTSVSVGERYACSAYFTPVFMTGASVVQSTSTVGFETLYAGYRYDGTTPQMYYVRNRFLLPMIGTWNRRDPLGYVDGMNLYRFYEILGSVDPSGLRICKCTTTTWGAGSGGGGATTSAARFVYTKGSCSKQNSFNSGLSGGTSTICTHTLTRDEVEAVGICSGDPACEESLARIMTVVSQTTSGVIAPFPYFIDENGYCFEYMERFRANYKGNWENGNTMTVAGGCTIELLEVFPKLEKLDPETGRVVTCRNVWGHPRCSYASHGIGRVCCGVGINRKCMYFDVGSESYTGQFGEDDKWFPADDVNFVDEIDRSRDRPFY